jgi:tetratricopeptide (TPR) repeat protein
MVTRCSTCLLIGSLLLSMHTTTLLARDATEVSLKVAASSGFLGMGGPRYLIVAPSTQNRDTILNAENVNAGRLYYFLVRSGEGWSVDADFVRDELPKITIIQKEKLFKLEFRDSLPGADVHGEMLVGFSKAIRLNEPLRINFPVEGSGGDVLLKVPMELWPGYNKVVRLTEESSAAMQQHRYPVAIASCNQIVRDQPLSIFPAYADAQSRRFQAFDRHYRDAWSGVVDLFVHDTLDLERKINKLTGSVEMLQFVNDSLNDPATTATGQDTASDRLQRDVALRLSHSVRRLDSLHQALDYQTIKWILTGSSRGDADYRYKYMLEALTFAFLTSAFSDSSLTIAAGEMPERITTALKKFNLTKAYDTFIRVSADRQRKKLTLFPAEFLQNVRVDTAALPLPFYSMLKAVQDFTGGNYFDANREILNAMRQTYDEDLLEGLDNLRNTVADKQKRLSADIVQRLREARIASSAEDDLRAMEILKDVLTLTPDCAYAAFELGKVYQRLGETVKAANYFQKAISLEPYYFNAYEYLYQNALKSNSYQVLPDVMSAAIAKGFDSYIIQFYLSVGLNNVGSYPEALHASQAALAWNSQGIHAYIQASLAHQGMGEFNRAREVLQRAASIDLENPEIIECQKELEEAIKHKSTNPTVISKKQ